MKRFLVGALALLIVLGGVELATGWARCKCGMDGCKGSKKASRRAARCNQSAIQYDNQTPNDATYNPYGTDGVQPLGGAPVPSVGASGNQYQYYWEQSCNGNRCTRQLKRRSVSVQRSYAAPQASSPILPMGVAAPVPAAPPAPIEVNTGVVPSAGPSTEEVHKYWRAKIEAELKEEQTPKLPPYVAPKIEQEIDTDPDVQLQLQQKFEKNKTKSKERSEAKPPFNSANVAASDINTVSKRFGVSTERVLTRGNWGAATEVRTVIKSR